MMFWLSEGKGAGSCALAISRRHGVETVMCDGLAHKMQINPRGYL